MKVMISVQWIAGADTNLPLPAYQTAGAAGADICANLPLADRAEGQSLAPGAIVLVPTGLRMQIPAGFEVQVRPRVIVNTFATGLLLLLFIPLAEGLQYLQTINRIPILADLP